MGIGRTIPRNFLANNPRAVEARGIYIYDEHGKEYIDGCSGALVSNLGHGIDQIIDDIAFQMKHLDFAHPSRWNHSACQDAADQICELTPKGINHCWFVSGGSEAVESAVKMARQYFVERDGKESTKHKLISRHCSYHGATIGAYVCGWHLRQDRSVPAFAYPFGQNSRHLYIPQAFLHDRTGIPSVLCVIP